MSLSDHLPSGIWQYCLLDDITTERLLTIRHVFDTGNTDVPSGSVARTTYWGGNFFTGKKLHGSLTCFISKSLYYVKTSQQKT